MITQNHKKFPKPLKQPETLKTTNPLPPPQKKPSKNLPQLHACLSALPREDVLALVAAGECKVAWRQQEASACEATVLGRKQSVHQVGG